MAVAPIVEYYRLVSDGSGTGKLNFLLDSNNQVTPATLLDFGTVDAGTGSTLETDFNKITTGTSASVNPEVAKKENLCQIYAIYNNRNNGAGNGTNPTSAMQNAVLSLVNKDGNSGTGEVYLRKWVHVALNTTDGNNPESDGIAVALGRSADDVRDGVEEGKLSLTAVGLDQQTDAGWIMGDANTGTVGQSNADLKNYAQVAFWLDIKNDAPAGPHEFRIRVTYSYT